MNRIDLVWDASTSTDVISYQVHRADSTPVVVGSDSLLGGGTGTSFTDTTALEGTTYYYVVAAVDGAGNVSAGSNEVSVTLRDVEVPTVTSQSPTGTAVPVGSDVVAGFSEPIDPASVTDATVSLTRVSGAEVQATRTLSEAGTTVTLDPIDPLDQSTSYTVTISGGAGGVKDLAGNALTEDVSWSFTTTDATTPPTVTATTPANDATGVATGVSPTVTLSEPIAEGSVTTTTVTLTGPLGASVPAGRSVTGATITIDPTDPLAGQTRYTVTIKGGSGGVTDTAGNALAADATWSFTTVDTAPPAAPTGLTAVGGNNVIALAWSPSTSPDVTDYRVYRATNSPVNPDSADLVGNVPAGDPLTKNDFLAANGTQYFYVVTAVDAAGNASTASPEATATPGANEIVVENAKAGSPASEWDIDGAGDASIQGFATDISVDQGQTVDFKIDTTSSDYSIDIYRLGYYGGDGARKVATIPTAQTTETNQPACIEFDGTTNDNLIDCGNWSVSANWSVPNDAVSGVYIARPKRADTDGASHIVFIVRDDDGGSDLLFQTSDTTWQAYNGYGGYSLYANPGHAHKVSYNRPFTTRDTPTEDWLFNAEYPMIRWIERNGYDVSYFTGIDTHRSGAELLEHKAFLSVGHDEYWSAEQRTAVETAREAGKHLAFMSGNEIYWKTRWEPSPTPDGTANRTLVSFKEGSAQGSEHYDCAGNYTCDPDPDTWTGLWRENTAGHDGGRPENALSGQISWGNDTAAMDVAASDAGLRFWRDAGLTGATTLDDGLIGYEFDHENPTYASSNPPGRITVSDTTVGGLNHKMSLYKAPSGAIVFGAGTVQWTWGLDKEHDRALSGAAADPRVQQATVNVFADMGVQPATLQGSLQAAVGPSDAIAPISTITSPTAGQPVANGATVTVTGTASDPGEGKVAAVEVSTDGGTTWRSATGRTSWTYSFTAEAASGSTITIQSRAVDDSLNIETAATGVAITVDGTSACTQATPCSIFEPNVTGVQDADPGAVELGVKFQSSEAGQITGIRFFKTTGNTGTHTGRLWVKTGDGTGTLVPGATVEFTAETASGWQEALFATPVTVDPDTTYVATYHTTSGRYAVGTSLAAAGVSNPPLRALQGGEDGPNGVYRYGDGGIYPTQSFGSANYLVDVLFATQSGPDEIAPLVAGVAPVTNATEVAVTTNVAATFTESMTASSISSDTVQLLDPNEDLVPAAVTYDGAARRVTLDPTANLAASTTYTARVKGGSNGAKDLAGNVLAADVTWAFTTAAPLSGGTFSLFADVTPGLSSDRSDYELGTRFTSSEDGVVTAVRFYKGPQNTGTHSGRVWNATTQALLGQVQFTGESATGWQTAVFDSPVAVSAGTQYIVSYTVPVGYYAFEANYFTTKGATAGPLTAPQSIPAARNGVFTGTPGAFPSSSYNDSNYFVDVVFAADVPTVTMKSPAAGASEVPAAAEVVATFSRPLDPTTVTESTFTLTAAGGPAVSADVSASGSKATLTPRAPLEPGTVYMATLTTGVKDSSGIALAQNVTWTFTTDGTPPTITGRSPAEGTTDAPTMAKVVATFDEPIDPETVTGTSFTLTGPGGAPVAAAVSASGTTATLTPAAPFLAPETAYTVTLTTGVSDVSGNALAADESWTFTTAPAETTPPTLDSTSPVDGATDVPVGDPVVATFSEPIDPGSVTDLTFTLSGAGGESGPTVATRTVSGSTVTLTPQDQLAADTLYTASVAGVADLNGNPLSGTVSWTFRTIAGDFSGPVIVTRSPEAGLTDASVEAAVVVVFNEPIDAATVTAATFSLTGPGGAVVPATRSSTSDSATLTPTEPLQVAATYSVTVSGVKDIAGNTMAADPWTFTTSADDTLSPKVTDRAPANGATNAPTEVQVVATFSEAVDQTTVDAGTFTLTGPGGADVAATVDATAGDSATLTPSAPLSAGTTYTVLVKGGAGGVKDLAGNRLKADVTWEFTVRAAADPRQDPNAGPGGPVLVVAGSGFSRYLPEIMRAEGLNLFEVGAASDLTAAGLEPYTSVVLGETSLTGGQVTALTDWVTDGGDLVAMRPDPALAGLMGITSTSNTLSEGYIKVDDTVAPGAGIVAESMQFHGTADRYTADTGTQVVATLYSSATSATSNPAVTTRAVGTAGGSATAFTYDLARSVVLTRQGNPAWINQNRDGQAGPNRANDLFYGAMADDPQQDWVDLDKVDIPQADEQQRLLANILTTSGLDNLPLPRFWYLPRGEEAALVLTADEHGSGDTAGRFDEEISASQSDCNIADWDCVRSTAYIYAGDTDLSESEATAYQADGFEVALHAYTACESYTRSEFADALVAQLAEQAGNYPGLDPSTTNRNHCIAWSDYTTVPEELAKQNIHLDTNYYYWPGEWVDNTPGLFTGSGFAQRFAKVDGTLVDTYQATTQMTDESGQSYGFTTQTLLDNALTKGYYGTFVANLHTDGGSNAVQNHDATVAAAQARGVPLITAQQLLTWTDGRNASSFGDLTWDAPSGTLAFSIDKASGARGLQAMLPGTSAGGGALLQVVGPDGPVTVVNRTIKGIEYAAFPTSSGGWTATYAETTAPTVIDQAPANEDTGVAAGDPVTATFSEPVTGLSDTTFTVAPVESPQSPAPGAVGYDTQTRTATFTPDGELDPSTEYTVSLTAGIEDGAGNELAPVTWTFTTAAAPMPPAAAAVTESTVTQFGAGSGTDTTVVDEGDGEVILTPALVETFAGSDLPSGWESDNAAGGETAVVDGALTVDGAAARTTAGYEATAGRFVEFVATFTAEGGQVVGLSDGAAEAGDMFALFGTNDDGTSVVAITGDGTATSDEANIEAATLGEPHRYRVDWGTSEVVFSVDEVPIHTEEMAIAGPMVVLAGDTTPDSPLVGLEWVRVGPYAASGSFTSHVLDAADTSVWGAVAWTASELPEGSALAVEFRSGDVAAPDETWSAFTAVATGEVPDVPPGRYAQYRVLATSTDPRYTPTLEAITIGVPAGG